MSGKGFSSTPPSFIDAFAGCGGLSLGLMKAGFNGLFAIERDSDAFETIQTNFLRLESEHRYAWPAWLPQRPHLIESLLASHGPELAKLSDVTLLAGGPPCQGFSCAGRRRADDPRNELVRQYLALVRQLRPRMVLLENVRGFTFDFPDDNRDAINFADLLKSELASAYHVYSRVLRASDFGVPQLRPRFFLIGLRKDLLWPKQDPLDVVVQRADGFLKQLGISAPVTARQAISDLEIARVGTIVSPDNPQFKALGYCGPLTPYQRLMNAGIHEGPADTRLARHGKEIIDKFSTVIEECIKANRLSTQIPETVRRRFDIKKQAFRVIDPERPAPTITSMPDDLLHYSEPRTLTVRENARLQSFPDNFCFRGKYTTGGARRRLEVPRFTQVANAVPPLLAQQIGEVLLEYAAAAEATRQAA